MCTKLSNVMLRFTRLIVVSGSLLTVNQALAEKYEPEGIQFGSIIYYPYANLAVSYDDNILSQESNAKYSTITNIGAGVLMKLLQENSRGIYDIDVALRRGIVNSSHADDYTDGRLIAGYTYQPSDKFGLKAAAGIKRLQDTKTPITIIPSYSPDMYQDVAADGEWYYGINDWDGADSLVTLNYTDRAYQTNLAVNEAKDRQQFSVAGLLRFPLAPNTRFRVSGRYIQFDYDISNNQDSSQLRAMAGVEWQASAQTLISADLGMQNKKFDLISSEDDSDISWKIGVTWSPEEFNMVRLTATNDFDESTTAASHLKKRKVDTEWKYGWANYLTMRIAAGTSRDTSVNAVSTTLDTVNYLLLSFEFGLRQTVRIKGGFTSTNINSQIAGGSSSKNTISIGVTAAL